MALANAEELAWAAGLFEGEGCIRTEMNAKTPVSKTWNAKLILGMKDQDVVERFAEIAGIGRVYPRRESTFWVWEANRLLEVQGFLYEILPLLGSRRAKKARVVLALKLTARGRKAKVVV